jgi:hypothetical protein
VAQLKNLKNNYMSAPKVFTKEMCDFYIKGQQQRTSLNLIGHEILGLTGKERYPHIYIYSQPGLGKSWTVNDALARSPFKGIIIKHTSTFKFFLNLAVLNYQRHLDKSTDPLLFHIEDCNDLFKNVESLNDMKSILGDDRCYHYQKFSNNWLKRMTDFEKRAIEFHKNLFPDEIGIKVPTDNMVFIITSNDRLPDKNTEIKSNLDQHKLAIRSRIQNVYDFDVSDRILWGSIVDTALNTKLIDAAVPKSIIEEAALFMWEHWDVLKETSNRTIDNMCEDYRKSPKSYKSVWEVKYLSC